MVSVVQQRQSQRNVMAPSTRKPTCSARREEIAALQKEIEALRAQYRRERSRLRIRPARPQSQEIHKSIAVAVGEGTRLRGAAHRQNLHFAGLTGLLNAEQIAQRKSPLHIPIHLPRDPALRRETLLQCLPQKIADARSFVLHRSSALDLQQPFSSRNQFVDPVSGDHSLVLFDITPFPGVSSISKVYEAFRYWTSNMEICIAESTGSVTIREDNEEDDFTHSEGAFCAQRRLVSAEVCGVTVEANQAAFHQVLGENEVVVAIQGLDSDEFYPYQPRERVRLEMTGAFRISKAIHGASVTLARCATVRLHAGSIATPQQLQHVLTQSTSRWIDVVLRVIHERVYQ